ncbi:MAG: hypothetical protein NDI60_04970 [Elusimicrobiales bacterium]|nr:hypothetical protein [Elusimicrobiales bacterium]
MIKIIALILALTPAVPLGAAEAGMEKYACDGNVFTALIPSAWEKEEEIIVGRQEKQYGVDLYSPGQPPGAAISLIYFGPDHPRFKTMDAYIATLMKTEHKNDGEILGKLEDTLVAGRKSKILDMITYAMLPAYSPKPKKAEMFERYVIVPAKKGFYSLTLKAPKGEAKGHLAMFGKILDSFKPAR